MTQKRCFKVSGSSPLAILGAFRIPYLQAGRKLPGKIPERQSLQPADILLPPFSPMGNVPLSAGRCSPSLKSRTKWQENNDR